MALELILKSFLGWIYIAHVVHKCVTVVILYSVGI